MHYVRPLDVLYDPPIVRRATQVIAAFLALPALASCGRSGHSSPPASTAPRGVVPALATRPPATGEIVVRGDATPLSKGPYAFDGRYLVRFEQYAPEDATLDFRSQTPFSASLTPRRDDPRGAIKLVEAAARRGRNAMTLHGRYFVSADFGDFPFVVRFTLRATA